LPQQIRTASVFIEGDGDRATLAKPLHALLVQPSDGRLSTERRRGSSGQPRKILISGSSFVQMIPTSPASDEEYFDLCAMHYIPENYGDANIERGFFELMEADAWRGDPAATFMLFGYPTNFRKVDYDSPSIAVRQIVTSAKYRSASRAASVHSIEMMQSR
jgi:hypothetical protein